jgi:hypothetical protein
MAEGWIKLHRQILDNAIFKRPEYLRIWVYILLKANHRDVEDIWNNQKKVFKKGSVVLSQKKISTELNVPLGTVNNVLKYLKSENQIEIITTSKYTEIQIIKWEDYQEAESTSERKVKAKRTPIESQHDTDPTPVETNKNDNNSNNDKNEKNDNNIAALWPLFDDFWDKYDHKQDRAKCEKHWKKINQEAREKIMMHLDLYIPATPDKKYRKHPATYLNNKSWENEVIENGKGNNKNDRTEFISNELTLIYEHSNSANR